MEFGFSRNKGGYVGEHKKRTVDPAGQAVLDKAQFARIAIHPMFSCGGHSKQEYQQDVKETSHCLSGGGCPNFIMGHGGACYKKTPIKRKDSTQSGRAKCRCVQIPFDEAGDMRTAMFRGQDVAVGSDGAYENVRVILHVASEATVEIGTVINRQRDRIRYFRANSDGQGGIAVPADVFSSSVLESAPEPVPAYDALVHARLESTATWGLYRIIFLNSLLHAVVQYVQQTSNADIVVSSLVSELHRAYFETIALRADESTTRSKTAKTYRPTFINDDGTIATTQAFYDFVASPLNEMTSIVEYWARYGSPCLVGRATAATRDKEHGAIVRVLAAARDHAELSDTNDSRLFFDAMLMYLSNIHAICMASRACVLELADRSTKYKSAREQGTKYEANDKCKGTQVNMRIISAVWYALAAMRAVGATLAIDTAGRFNALGQAIDPTGRFTGIVFPVGAVAPESDSAKRLWRLLVVTMRTSVTPKLTGEKGHRYAKHEPDNVKINGDSVENFKNTEIAVGTIALGVNTAVADGGVSISKEDWAYFLERGVHVTPRSFADKLARVLDPDTPFQEMRTRGKTRLTLDKASSCVVKSQAPTECDACSKREACARVREEYRLGSGPAGQTGQTAFGSDEDDTFDDLDDLDDLGSVRDYLGIGARGDIQWQPTGDTGGDAYELLPSPQNSPRPSTDTGPETGDLTPLQQLPSALRSTQNSPQGSEQSDLLSATDETGLGGAYASNWNIGIRQENALGLYTDRSYTTELIERAVVTGVVIVDPTWESNVGRGPGDIGPAVRLSEMVYKLLGITQLPVEVGPLWGQPDRAMFRRYNAGGRTVDVIHVNANVAAHSSPRSKEAALRTLYHSVLMEANNIRPGGRTVLLPVIFGANAEETANGLRGAYEQFVGNGNRISHNFVLCIGTHTDVREYTDELARVGIAAAEERSQAQGATQGQARGAAQGASQGQARGASQGASQGAAQQAREYQKSLKHVLEWEGQQVSIATQCEEELDIWFEWAKGKTSTICICNGRHDGAACDRMASWSSSWDSTKRELQNSEAGRWLDLESMYHKAIAFNHRDQGTALAEYNDTRDFISGHHGVDLGLADDLPGSRDPIRSRQQRPQRPQGQQRPPGQQGPQRQQGQQRQIVVDAIIGLFTDEGIPAADESATANALALYGAYMGNDPANYEARMAELADDRILGLVQSSLFSVARQMTVPCLWALGQVMVPGGSTSNVQRAALSFTLHLHDARNGYMYSAGAEKPDVASIRQNALDWYIGSNGLDGSFDEVYRLNRNMLARDHARRARDMSTVPTLVLEWATLDMVIMDETDPIVVEYRRRAAMQGFGKKKAIRVSRSMLYTLD